MSVCNVDGEQLDPDARGCAVSQGANAERLRSLLIWQLAQAGVDQATIGKVMGCADRTVRRRLAAIPRGAIRRGPTLDLARLATARN